MWFPSKLWQSWGKIAFLASKVCYPFVNTPKDFQFYCLVWGWNLKKNPGNPAEPFLSHTAKIGMKTMDLYSNNLLHWSRNIFHDYLSIFLQNTRLCCELMMVSSHARSLASVMGENIWLVGLSAVLFQTELSEQLLIVWRSPRHKLKCGGRRSFLSSSGVKHKFIRVKEKCRK